jgi:hypothetical protein
MFKSAWLLSGISAFGVLAGSAMAQEAKPMPAPAPAPAAATAPVIIGGCNSGCCTSGCSTGCFDSCGCENDCAHGHILADISFMVISPFWKSNPAMYVTETNPVTGTNVINEKEFGRPEQEATKVELGYITAGGWGLRIDWWGFATGKGESLTSPDPAGNALAFGSATPLGLFVDKPSFGSGGTFAALYKLEMDIWDFEAIRSYESGNSAMLTSLGIRSAHIGMGYSAVDFFGPSGGALAGTPHNFLVSGTDINAWGLTGSVQARTGNRLYATGTFRGSLLYGTGGQHAANAHVSFGGTQSTINDVQDNFNTLIPALELEAGIGVKGDESRRLVPFLEIGVNLQGWWNVGNPSRSTVGLSPTGGFGTSPPSFIGATGADETLGLLGFYIKGGLTF